MPLLFHPCWGKAVFFKSQPAFQKLNFYGSLSTALLVPATRLPCIQLLALCLSRWKYLKLHEMKGTESSTSSPVLGRGREQFCLTPPRQQVCDKKYRAITQSAVLTHAINDLLSNFWPSPISVLLALSSSYSSELQKLTKYQKKNPSHLFCPKGAVTWWHPASSFVADLIPSILQNEVFTGSLFTECVSIPRCLGENRKKE